MNKMELRFTASLENQSFARTAIASFMMSLNPSIDEIDEVKTIVSEAVSNAIIHGYQNNSEKYVYLKATIEKNILLITIQDYGIGIEDVSKVMEDFYTTSSNKEHAGMGFTIMKAFSDNFEIFSTPNLGTKVVLAKVICNECLVQ